MREKLFIAGIIILIVSVNCTRKPKGGTVIFPEVSAPVQITQNGKEHLFGSYCGINSFSKSQKFATVLETDVKYCLPTENDKAVLGLVNLQTKEFILIAEASAWNFQQGCMAHWLATSPDLDLPHFLSEHEFNCAVSLLRGLAAVILPGERLKIVLRASP